MDKITREEEQLCRYVDGEMRPEELAAFEVLLAGDESLRGEVEAMRRVGGLARAVLGGLELPAPELFRERVMRQVEGRVDGRRAGGMARRGRGVTWQGLPWAVAGLSVAAAVMVTLIDLRGGGEMGRDRGVPEGLVGAYAPQESVTAEWRYDRGAQATVIELEGLPELPADFDVAGLRLDGTERASAAMVGVSLLELDGSPMVVVVDEGRRAPRGFRVH